MMIEYVQSSRVSRRDCCIHPILHPSITSLIHPSIPSIPFFVLSLRAFVHSSLLFLICSFIQHNEICFYWCVSAAILTWLRLSRNEEGEEPASNTKQNSLNREDNQYIRPIKLLFSALDQKSDLSNIKRLPFLTSFKVLKVILTSLFVNVIYDKRESGHVLGEAFPLFSVGFYILCAKVVGLYKRPSLFAIKNTCFFFFFTCRNFQIVHVFVFVLVSIFIFSFCYLVLPADQVIVFIIIIIFLNFSHGNWLKSWQNWEKIMLSSLRRRRVGKD